MDWKCSSSAAASSLCKAPLNVSTAMPEKALVETNVDIDLREIYFLIMQFLSTGPCQRTFEQFSKELLEHQLLPRRYHAWFSRSGEHSGNDDDDGISFPLSYNNLVERYTCLLYYSVLIINIKQEFWTSWFCYTICLKS